MTVHNVGKQNSLLPRVSTRISYDIVNKILQHHALHETPKPTSHRPYKRPFHASVHIATPKPQEVIILAALSDIQYHFTHVISLERVGVVVCLCRSSKAHAVVPRSSHSTLQAMLPLSLPRLYLP